MHMCEISCNQPKVVPEAEIQAPRGEERQYGVGDTLSVWHGCLLANPTNNQLMRTFKYNGAKLWNALAISVSGKPSLNSFKGAYLKDLFTHRYFLMVL